MELFQAILLFFNTTWLAYGTLPLYTIFSFVVLIIYVVKRKKSLLGIWYAILVAGIYTVLVTVISKSPLYNVAFEFFLLISVNIVLAGFAIENRWALSGKRFANCITILHLVFTVIAFVYISSPLWVERIYQSGEHALRLRLFYREPTYFAYICGILFIVYIYELLTEKLTAMIIVGLIVCFADMVLSYGVAGIISTSIAVVVLGICTIAVNREGITSDENAKTRWGIAAIFLAVLMIAFGSLTPILGVRLQNIFSGKDTGLFFTLQYPLRSFLKIMDVTGGRGSGIGNLPAHGVTATLYNSFFQVITEGGTLAVVVLVVLILVISVYVLLYGNPLAISLLAATLSYQMTSGHFEDSIHWIIYGVIIAICTREKEIRKDRIAKASISGDTITSTAVVAIIGAKGLKNYGGYETFVDKLTEYHMNSSQVKYLIACKKNGTGAMDESILKGAVSMGENRFIYHNSECFKIPVPQIGTAQAIIYDLLAARYAINYFKKNNIKEPVLYILTCRIGPFAFLIKNAMKELGGYYYVNPDGNEWRRSLYSPMVRKYWKLSERLMVKHADLVICDSKNIETYINATYYQYKPKTTYIAYGAELRKSSLSDDSEKVKEWFEVHGIKSKEYYLLVGRFVPENNYETILREFMNSNTKKSLVVITNVQESFLNELEDKLHFSMDKRIRFVGTMYDNELLKKVRENAYGYIHGHEVGGTNPSLLEALSSTDINLLLDVGFNRECGENSALYWNKEVGNLCKLIDKADGLMEDEVEKLSVLSKKRIEDAYRWELIASEYMKVWQKEKESY